MTSYVPLLSALFALVFIAPMPADATKKEVDNRLHVVFDLGGVLAETNYSVTIGKTVGPILKKQPGKLARLFGHNFVRGIDYQERFYEILTLAGNAHNIVDVCQENAQPCDPKGRAIPALMRVWLRGTMHPTEIRDLVCAWIDDETNAHHFYNAAERQLMHTTVTTLFTPEVFAQTRTVMPQGIQLLKACIKKGYSISILSNFDSQSAQEVVKQIKKHLPEGANFKVASISGDHKQIKPERQFYEQHLRALGIDPTDKQAVARCAFFDDQMENIMAANRVGIHGIHIGPSKAFKKSGHTIAYKELKVWAKEHAKKDAIRNTPTARIQFDLG